MAIECERCVEGLACVDQTDVDEFVFDTCPACEGTGLVACDVDSEHGPAIVRVDQGATAVCLACLREGAEAGDADAVAELNRLALKVLCSEHPVFDPRECPTVELPALTMAELIAEAMGRRAS